MLEEYSKSSKITCQYSEKCIEMRKSRGCVQTENIQESDIRGIKRVYGGKYVEKPNYEFKYKLEKNGSELKGSLFTVPYFEINKILSCIDDESVVLLGFGHHFRPEDMMMKNLLVLPTCDRPPTHINGTQRDHSLTKKYKDILKQKDMYYNAINAGDDNEIRNKRRTLMDHLNTLIKGN